MELSLRGMGCFVKSLTRANALKMVRAPSVTQFRFGVKELNKIFDAIARMKAGEYQPETRHRKDELHESLITPSTELGNPKVWDSCNSSFRNGLVQLVDAGRYPRSCQESTFISPW